MIPDDIDCPHCKSSMTEAHCENKQCDWIRCVNCRMITRIVAV